MATDNGTSYMLEVPFTMNKMTSKSEIGGVKMRIRAADTDLELGRLAAEDTQVSSNSLSYAYFDLTPIAASIIVGKYYKIQLAYIDAQDSTNIGYYSTVSIVKCTAYPSVGIANLSSTSTNPDYGSYVGEYSNINDPSEKCYNYSFTVYDNQDNILTTTGWLLHNANTDENTYSSTDNYNLSYAFEPNTKYKIQYSIITNNGLIVTGPKYLILGATAIAPELKADLVATLNYDEGVVDLSFTPWRLRRQEALTTTYTGSFTLSRASSKDNFKFWTKLKTFTLTGTLPTGTIFTDFTVEHGYTYRYAIQQFNIYNVQSQRVCAPDIDVAFEDMFLYDGDRQLKVRFNPKVTSFKIVRQDTKKNTLGNKFPFFFRNGNVAYKEFPISGLISYLGDENEFFLNRKTDLGMPIDWTDTTDIIDENVAYERKFKLDVMNWLEDGNIKLFRSPGEGNYLVRLMNVSLSPNDTVSRMLHTFTCTADEIADCTTENLVKYKFLNSATDMPLELCTYTIVFKDRIESILSSLLKTTDAERLAAATTTEVQQVLKQFRTTDLLEGNGCVALEFKNCSTANANSKVWFTFNQNRYIVNNGTYTQEYDEPGYGLYITNPTRGMPGEVTCTVLAIPASGFDNIAKLETATIIDTPTYNGVNYIESINNIKYQINTIDQLTATLNRGYTLINNIALLETTYSYFLINGAWEGYDVIASLTSTTRDELKLAINASTVYGDDEKTRLCAGVDDAYTAMQTWTLGTDVGREYNIDYSIRNLINQKYLTHNLWQQNYYFEDRNTGIIYKFDRSSWHLYRVSELPTVELITVDKRSHKTSSELVQLESNQFCLNNTLYTVTADTPITLQAKDITTSLTQLYWGPRVNMMLIYTLLKKTYQVELDNLTLSTAWDLYNEIAMRQAADKLNLKSVTADSSNVFYSHQANTQADAVALVTNIPNKDYDENSYFYWDTIALRFARLSRSERAAFTDTIVWIPAKNTEYEYYGINYTDASEYAHNYYQQLEAALAE